MWQYHDRARGIEKLFRRHILEIVPKFPTTAQSSPRSGVVSNSQYIAVFNICEE